MPRASVMSFFCGPMDLYCFEVTLYFGSKLSKTSEIKKIDGIFAEMCSAKVIIFSRISIEPIDKSYPPDGTGAPHGG